MASDYIPRPDAEFDSWQANFVTYANANLLDLGLTAADMAPVNAGQGSWNMSYPAHVSAQASAQAARNTKDNDRATYEGAIRPLVRRMQASASVDDTEKAALGITVPDDTLTPVPIPTSKPVGTVDARQRLRHTISFADEGTPTNKAKPFGVIGAEIWVKTAATGTPPPSDPGELVFLALDTRTPHLAEYDGAEGGKTAHYWLRWVNSRGQKGPWSETVSATIGA